MNKLDKFFSRLSDIFGPRFVSLVVLFHGILIIVLTLLDQLALKHYVHLNDLSLDITLGVGLTLIYLSALLSRRKRSAFIIAAVAYSFYLGANIEGLTDELQSTHKHDLALRLTILIIRDIVLPLAVLFLLFINRRKFVVRSDSQGFQTAIFISLIILAITFVYGTTGFYVLGNSGFHHQLSIPAAMHYTVDQLNVTTNQPLKAYNKRANLFSDSLSFITIFAVLYVLISFVQPLRARFGDQRVARARFLGLLHKQHNAVSEDFFKLWPPDKQYFFDSTGESGLAFHVYRGSALILAGPAGKQARFRQLLGEFQAVCLGNDWRPAIIHADDSLREDYEQLGYTMQLIGQEAMVDLHKFNSQTIKDKYFRNIINRFDKRGYTFQFLSPPHNQAVLLRLKEISDQWLGRGNHVERGYAMGYFSESYISACEVAVARDGAGTIQSFLNLVPADFDKKEATYDLMRASAHALSNVNDFLLINLAQSLEESGYLRLNLGFCLLVGLESEENKGLISSLLGFAYANGDRFYSFSGLYKFKNKYQPKWEDRYVFYQGGVRGFSKTMNALVRVMSSSPKHHFPSKGDPLRLVKADRIDVN